MVATERGTRQRQWAPAALCAAALVCASAPLARAAPAPNYEAIYRAWIDQQKAAVQMRLQQWDASIAQARQAVDRANALQSASSPVAREVAQRAFTVANTALQRALAGWARDADQLRALDRMLDPLVLRLVAASKRGDDVVVTSHIGNDGIYIRTRTGRSKLPGVIRLQPGDTLETGASSTDVMVADGSMLTIGPNSVLTYEADDGYELKSGKIRRVIQCMWKNLTTNDREYCGKVRHRNPDLAVSVRGTDYAVETLPGGTTSVMVLEGTVELRVASGPVIPVSAGQQLQVGPDGAVRGPTPIDAGAARWWESD